MNDDDKCPCEAVRELRALYTEHDKMLSKGATQFAVINTKMNLISFIGAALTTSIVGMIVMELAK
jgi:hypothetical protein